MKGWRRGNYHVEDGELCLHDLKTGEWIPKTDTEVKVYYREKVRK